MVGRGCRQIKLRCIIGCLYFLVAVLFMDDWKDLIEYLKFIEAFILYQALHYLIKSLKNSFQTIKNYIKIVNYPVQNIIQI